MPRPRKEKASAPLFRITLRMGDQCVEATGDTALEALENMERPLKIVVKGVLTLENNGSVKEYALPPIRIKRLFYPMTRRVVAKQLGLLSL